MKLFRKILLGFAALVGLAAIIILLFYRQETYQLYKVLTFFDKGNISENFRGVKNIFPTTTVPKPDRSDIFPMSSKPYSLPTSFQVNDSTVDTNAFLDFTLTDALIVIQNDTVRYESYSNGFKVDDHHISWSMSKSVVSALLGIAIGEGKIKSIEQTVTDYLPDFAGTGYDKVRIKDLLQMSSGVGFNEDYGDFNSDINLMGRYFALGMPMADFAKTLKREREPGTYNHYVSIDTQVLGMILTKATGQSITQYMNEKLWSQIGSEAEAFWIVDKSGMEFALGGLNATARDYAKLGQLFLDTGKWQGRQIVPREWVLASITPDAPHVMPGKRANAELADGYGFQWWIPEGSKGEFDAQGIYDQFIYIDPKSKMVIVKLSSNYHFKNDKKRIFHELEIALFRKIVEEASQ
ncbi:MAG: serine hydrolase [Cytophagales bacterium]|nr:serine hydrolase [Cytophagales bacterium]MCA6365552.1 serine hydrolase [Cytophagales bacterium]MCA6372495.1 serine hydrolase [Cytophagales bacterium]MCA6374271.1 serine hydrolase [Cytophagales bacterium]MCA6383226.1 serine hydrolase [Cytophagales bacterium]